MDKICDELNRIASEVSTLAGSAFLASKAVVLDNHIVRRTIPKVKLLDKNGIRWECTSEELNIGGGSRRVWWSKYKITLVDYNVVLTISLGSTHDDKIVYGREYEFWDVGRRVGKSFFNITKLFDYALEFCDNFNKAGKSNDRRANMLRKTYFNNGYSLYHLELSVPMGNYSEEPAKFVNYLNAIIRSFQNDVNDFKKLLKSIDYMEDIGKINCHVKNNDFVCTINGNHHGNDYKMDKFQNGLKKIGYRIDRG